MRQRASKPFPMLWRILLTTTSPEDETTAQIKYVCNTGQTLQAHRHKNTLWWELTAPDGALICGQYELALEDHPTPPIRWAEDLLST